MNNHGKPIQDAITESSGFVKKHSTYCTMKHLMVLKSMMDNGDWESRRSFFDNILSQKNLYPHQSPDDWAKGVEAIFQPNIGHINQVSQKFRKRIERVIHGTDLNNAGKKIGVVSDSSRSAAMRLKTVLAFSEQFPDAQINNNLLRRMRENHDNIMNDVMASRDINDSTLKGIYFGRGNFSLPHHIAGIMERNAGINSLVNEVMTSYQDYVDEKAIQNNMSRRDRVQAHKYGRISLWKNLREKAGVAVAGVGQTIKQGIAVVAISMLGVGAVEMSQQKNVDMSYSPSTSSVETESGYNAASEPPANLYDKLSSVQESVRKSAPEESSIGDSDLSQYDAITQLTYSVKEGDTLWALASDHLSAISGETPSDSSVANFMKKYGYQSQHVIHPGDRIQMEIDEDFFEVDADVSKTLSP